MDVFRVFQPAPRALLLESGGTVQSQPDHRGDDRATGHLRKLGKIRIRYLASRACASGDAPASTDTTAHEIQRRDQKPLLRNARTSYWRRHEVHD